MIEEAADLRRDLYTIIPDKIIHIFNEYIQEFPNDHHFMSGVYIYPYIKVFNKVPLADVTIHIVFLSELGEGYSMQLMQRTRSSINSIFDETLGSQYSYSLHKTVSDWMCQCCDILSKCEQTNNEGLFIYLLDEDWHKRTYEIWNGRRVM